MAPNGNSRQINAHLMVLALLLFAASCVFHIKNARSGNPIYRDQHLGTAIEYYKTKVDLLKPVIVGFNATGTPTPQELPVWQALAGLAFKIMGPWFGWANVVSLLTFCTCLFPLYGIARMFLGERCAWWTLVFFLAQPLIFIYAGEASTDGFSMVTSIWFLFFGIKLLERPTLVWWICAALMGALAAVSKLPFFMAAGLTCFFVLVSRHRSSLKAWILLATVGMVAGAFFCWWTNYTNRCIALAELPYVDLRVSNSESSFWYFGDLHYRLVPGNWLKGGWRVLNTCFGSFALAGLFLYAFCFIKDAVFPKLILLAGFITTLIFTHLVLHHSHYYLMFTPAFAMLCAQTANEWEKKITLNERWKSNVLFGIVAIALGLSIVQGVVGMKIVLDFDPYPHDIAKIIQTYSKPEDKLLIQNGGWGGNELILTDRRGLSIWTTQLLEDPATLKRLKELGYNKLVMISDSPLLTALQRINPGDSKFKGDAYKLHTTPVIKDWPMLYSTDDLLIMDIP